MSENYQNHAEEDKRRHSRIEAFNSVFYILFDADGNEIAAGRGETINLSQGGILLQTPNALKGVYVVLVSIDLQGRRIKLRGKVRHTRRDEFSHSFLTGIEFFGPKEEQIQAITSFVRVYQYKKTCARRKNV